MSTVRRVKQLKGEIARKYASASDLRGSAQALTVLVSLFLLWIAAVQGSRLTHWSLLITIPVLSLFLLRLFALMHDCGHGCLFRSRALNRAFGFLFGVISGMPQYVWARHHNFHHATNGNWERYRGAIATLSVREFAALSPAKQRRYARERHLGMAPLAGFIYLVLNPRLTWIKGTARLVGHLVRGKARAPATPFKVIAASFETRLWDSPREYWHMTANNLVLLAAVAAGCWFIGTATFLTIWILSTSLAGAAGLVLFTVQHNFEHAYAADTEHWDYDVGAIHGTSFLVLPAWLNWFTANIGYHHVHHLSASIPNYRLIRCHEEYRDLFTEVPRVSLAELPHAITCILWDEAAERIISIAEYRRQVAAAPATATLNAA